MYIEEKYCSLLTLPHNCRGLASGKQAQAQHCRVQQVARSSHSQSFHSTTRHDGQLSCALATCYTSSFVADTKKRQAHAALTDIKFFFFLIGSQGRNFYRRGPLNFQCADRAACCQLFSDSRCLVYFLF